MSISLAMVGGGTRERSDVARNRQAILHAATLLYEQADDLTTITMDDIAAAAGVGKGTVFRRFGDRAGLLRAVFDWQIAAMIEAIETGPSPLGPLTPPREASPRSSSRTSSSKPAIADSPSARRRRVAPNAPRFYDTANYQWTHKLLCGLLDEQAGAQVSGYAHALLSRTRIDLIEHLLDVEAYTPSQLKRLVLGYVSYVLADAVAPVLPSGLHLGPIKFGPASKSCERFVERATQVSQQVKVGRLNPIGVDVASDKPVGFGSSQDVCKNFVGDTIESIVKILVTAPPRSQLCQEMEGPTSAQKPYDQFGALPHVIHWGLLAPH